MEKENSILYTKAGELMGSALECYKKGNIKEAVKYHKQANEIYDVLNNYVESMESKDDMVFGEGRNFGIIYSTIEDNVPKWFLNKSKSKAIKELTEMIVKNPVLKSQFDIYNALQNINENVNIGKYVDEVFAQFPAYDKKTLVENNQKLIEFIQKYDGNEFVEIPEDSMKLYEAIEYMLTHKKTIKNISEHIVNKEVIEDYLSNHTVKDEKKENIDEGFKSSVEEMSEVYYNDLNDDERELMECIAVAGNGDVKAAFNGIKNELVTVLNETISESTSYDEKERWSNVLSKINEMQYNDENDVDNLIKLFEIKRKI